MHTELEELKSALDTHQKGGDFAADWNHAMTAAPPWKSFAAAGSVALIAASVLAWVGWTTLGPLVPEPGDPTVSAASAGVEPAMQVNAARTLGQGHFTLYRTTREVKSIAVVRPELLSVNPVHTGLFSLQGLSPGRTDMVVTFADGTSDIESLRVTTEPDSPHSTGWADVDVGSVLTLRSAGVTALAVADPTILEAVNAGQHLVLQGLARGTTDVSVLHGEHLEIISVEVGGPRGRHHPTLRRPPSRAVAMTLGSAVPYPGVLTDVKTVTTVRPEILGVTLAGDAMIWTGLQAGSTDVLLTAADGEVEAFTVTIE